MSSVPFCIPAVCYLVDSLNFAIILHVFLIERSGLQQAATLPRLTPISPRNQEGRHSRRLCKSIIHMCPRTGDRQGRPVRPEYHGAVTLFGILVFEFEATE